MATVPNWQGGYRRDRFLRVRRSGRELSCSCLEDDARSGRPRSVDHREIVSATLMRPPKKYGVTHRSWRLLATHLGIGCGTVARIWREYGVQPWRSESFKFSTDPELGHVIDSGAVGETVVRSTWANMAAGTQSALTTLRAGISRELAWSNPTPARSVRVVPMNKSRAATTRVWTPRVLCSPPWPADSLIRLVRSVMLGLRGWQRDAGRRRGVRSRCWAGARIVGLRELFGGVDERLCCFTESAAACLGEDCGDVVLSSAEGTPMAWCR